MVLWQSRLLCCSWFLWWGFGRAVHWVGSVREKGQHEDSGNPVSSLPLWTLETQEGPAPAQSLRLYSDPKKQEQKSLCCRCPCKSVLFFFFSIFYSPRPAPPREKTCRRRWSLVAATVEIPSAISPLSLPAQPFLRSCGFLNKHL